MVIYESVVLRYENAELALQTICVHVSQLLFCLSNILISCKMFGLVLPVEMGLHMSNPGINMGSLASLAFSHSLLQSLQCSFPLWACGSS